MSTAARLTRTERIALRDARRAADAPFAPGFDLMALLEGPTTAEDIAADAEAAAEEARLAVEAEARRCGRCGGTGHIAYYNFNQGGVCFGCNGTGDARLGGRSRFDRVDTIV